MKSTKKIIVKDQIRSNVNKNAKNPNEKRSGVIQTILDLIKKKPQTQETLIKGLVKAFPEREMNAMQKTIKAQLGAATRPTRMERERGVEFLISLKTIKNVETTLYTYIGEMEYNDEETED